MIFLSISPNLIIMFMLFCLLLVGVVISYYNKVLDKHNEYIKKLKIYIEFMPYFSKIIGIAISIKNDELTIKEINKIKHTLLSNQYSERERFFYHYHFAEFKPLEKIIWNYKEDNEKQISKEELEKDIKIAIDRIGIIGSTIFNDEKYKDYGNIKMFFDF